jgi:hypothetical protein
MGKAGQKIVGLSKNDLLSMVEKKKPKKDKVISVKVSSATFEKWERANLDIAKTIQNWMDWVVE